MKENIGFIGVGIVGSLVLISVCYVVGFLCPIDGMGSVWSGLFGIGILGCGLWLAWFAGLAIMAIVEYVSPSLAKKFENMFHD